MPTDLRQAIDDFHLSRRAARLAAMTLRYYECQLGLFADWSKEKGIHRLQQIRPTVLRTYFIYLQERGLKDNSIHAAARALRAFLNFCVREEYLDHSPMEKVIMPRQDHSVLPGLDQSDVIRLLESADQLRDRALVLVMLDTGARAAEICALDCGDVNLKKGDVAIRRGKGRKSRTVFLGDAARAALAAYLQTRVAPLPDDPLWPSLSGRDRLSTSGLRQMLERLSHRAGIVRVTPHAMRRTYAVNCLRNGMDLFRLARIMGHADIAVLRRYLSLKKDDLREAHRQFGVVDRILGEPEEEGE